MRSLVISRWGPGRIDSGTALRNTQNMAALAQRGPVDVIIVDTAGDPPPAPPLNGARTLAHYTPSPPPHIPGRWLLPGAHHLIRRYTDPALVRRLQELSGSDYELAVVEEIALAAYVPVLVATGIRTVFDAHNVEATLRAEIDQKSKASNSGLAALRQTIFDRKLQQAEAQAVKTADIVWACSAVDADLLTQIYSPRALVGVVPNAINVAAYATTHRERSAKLPDDPPTLLYVGTYAYPPNELAALRLMRDVLPALRASGIDLPLCLVGRDPTPAMRRAAEGDAAVTITGAVDTIAPYLAGNSVAVLPITIGGGTRLKILEAFAAGCPVISTRKGAEGIDVEHGKNVLLAESDADFVEAIQSLVNDPHTSARIGQGGYETVVKSYSWDAAARAVNATLDGTVT